MALRATVSGVVEIHAGAARSFALPSSSAVSHEAGTERRDAEMLALEFGAQRRREADQPVFAGLVGGRLAPRRDAEHAADVEHMRLFGRRQQRQQFGEQLHRRQQVDRHDAPPLLARVIASVGPY